ncbi:polymorphic toxin-type HINT domain-containing protein [Mammaliicoccus sp. Dog046]|uniref:polymorphic toxin-type HINT domain-containing protein n=1 Tax=Mammaliicoccus sp. Dog046 TaxID=3034233 RepID=UPI002B25E278|nr:polymorphic toxin-type HINT domain-containing protein [Mammaliicoccus sp. Dog046]WQK85418.1 polymorphic toxin-type HINT domain-containing protein [Mammaliicoccus sp. Dog046]
MATWRLIINYNDLKEKSNAIHAYKKAAINLKNENKQFRSAIETHSSGKASTALLNSISRSSKQLDTLIDELDKAETTLKNYIEGMQQYIQANSDASDTLVDRADIYWNLDQIQTCIISTKSPISIDSDPPMEVCIFDKKSEKTRKKAASLRNQSRYRDLHSTIESGLRSINSLYDELDEIYTNNVKAFEQEDDTHHSNGEIILTSFETPRETEARYDEYYLNALKSFGKGAWDATKDTALSVGSFAYDLYLTLPLLNLTASGKDATKRMEDRFKTVGKTFKILSDDPEGAITGLVEQSYQRADKNGWSYSLGTLVPDVALTAVSGGAGGASKVGKGTISLSKVDKVSIKKGTSAPIKHQSKHVTAHKDAHVNHKGPNKVHTPSKNTKPTYTGHSTLKQTQQQPHFNRNTPVSNFGSKPTLVDGQRPVQYKSAGKPTTPLDHSRVKTMAISERKFASQHPTHLNNLIDNMSLGNNKMFKGVEFTKKIGQWIHVKLVNSPVFRIKESRLYQRLKTKLNDAQAKLCINNFITNCFVAGTTVHTKNGLKRIEHIQIGDEVLSRNMETGRVSYEPVVTLHQKETDTLTSVIVTDAEGHTETLSSTPEHLYYVEQQGWIEAQSLKHDDILVTPTTTLTVQSVTHYKEQQYVYNFEVRDAHTYYVGQYGILVHNDCGYRVVTKSKDGIQIKPFGFNNLDEYLERSKVDSDFLKTQGYQSYKEVEQVTKNLHRYFEVKPKPRLINQRYAGQVHPNGARFNAIGFPVFEPPHKVATVQLDPSLYVATGGKQMREASMELFENLDANPEIYKLFSDTEISNLSEGIWPNRFSWHHHEVSGRMELVDYKFHKENKHTGGVAIWGENKR